MSQYTTFESTKQNFCHKNAIIFTDFQYARKRKCYILSKIMNKKIIKL